jgi:hypothetical protein
MAPLKRNLASYNSAQFKILWEYSEFVLVVCRCFYLIIVGIGLSVVRFLLVCRHLSPVTVAARSKAWHVFVRLNTGIVGSNSARGMDVCVYPVFVLSCVGSGLATGWSLVQGVLPIVYKCKITEPHKEEAKARYGLQRHIRRRRRCRHLSSWIIILFTCWAYSYILLSYQSL